VLEYYLGSWVIANNIANLVCCGENNKKPKNLKVDFTNGITLRDFAFYVVFFSAGYCF